MDAFKSHHAQLQYLQYRFQGFSLDVRNRKLSNAAGQEIKLSSRAFDTLVELVQHRGETLSKDHLMDSVWRGLVVEENNINQAICLVRKALGDPTGEPAFIKTVSGKGFCFVADVEVCTEAEAVAETSANASDVPGLPAETIVTDTVEIPAAVTAAAAIPALQQGGWRAYWKTGTAAVAASLVLAVGFINTHAGGDASRQVTAGEPPVAAALVVNQTPRIIAGSLAVMPFANLSEDPTSDVFARGLHDELTNQLATVANLKVIARDSVISAAASGASLFEMADALNVESMVTGTMLAEGERARINLQMLNAETGVTLWVKSFEVDTQSMSDMISAQSDIARKVVKALEVEARLPQPENLVQLPTQSFKAHRYYLTARHSYNHQDEEEKWVLLSKALELDPDFADAHLMFANINTALAVTPMAGFTHQEHLRLALASVDSYIRIRPDSPQGYALKSVVLGDRGDWSGAADQLAMVRRLGASESGMKYGALIKMSLGHFDEAVRIYEDVLMAEPANLYVRGLLMAAHEMVGNQHQARQEYALGNELKTVWWGRTVDVLLTLGRKEPMDPTNPLEGFSAELRHVLRNLHDPELVGRGVKRYSEGEVHNAKEDVFYSALAAYRGDTETANTLLRSSIEKVATSVFWAWLPVFADVRRTEEFRQLLVDAGVVAHWRQHGWPQLCQPLDNAAGSFRCH